jgi:hypothetical protein
MMTAGILDYASHDVDADVRRIGQLSAVGSMADEVLADLVKIHAKLIAPESSAAIGHAAALFTQAVDSLDRPLSVDAQDGYAADAHRMASAHAWAQFSAVSQPAPGSWRTDLERIRDALTAVAGGAADDLDFTVLQAEFTNIAAGTLDASYGVLHTRGNAASWLTA